MTIPALLTKSHGLHTSLTEEDPPTEPDKAEFLRLIKAFFASGGTSRYAEMERLLNEHHPDGDANLNTWIASGKVLAFAWRQSIWIPMFQFDLDHLSPKPLVHQIRLELDPDLMGWQQARWFAQRNPRLQGHRPVDLLDTQAQSLLEAARADRLMKSLQIKHPKSNEPEISTACSRPPQKARLLSRTLH